MTNIIDKYKMLLGSVSKLIEISGYKNKYIAQKIKMTPTHFSAKKSKGNWTIDEVEKIIKTISNEDLEDYLDELLFCPKAIQNDFRKIYQQLKIVDNPMEIRGVRKYKIGKSKIYLWKSRIALRIKDNHAHIGMFLYNEYYTPE